MTDTSTDSIDLSAVRVALIGAGNMGGPVGRTMLDAGVRPENLRIANSSPASSERAAEELAVRLVMPLGLCLLPAFVCWGVIPVVMALLGAGA